MSSSVHSGHSGKEHLPRTTTTRTTTTTTTGRGRVSKAFETGEDFSDEDEDDDDDEWEDDDDFIEEEEEGMEEEGAKYNNSSQLQLQQRQHGGANATSTNTNSSSRYTDRNQLKKEGDQKQQQQQQGREVFPTIAYNNLGKQTNFSQCLQARAKKWNPMKQFEPAKNGQFAPDWSFHEFEFPEHPDEIVEFTSRVGQRRFAFVLNTIDKEVRLANPELVELVVKSLLRCTNCDVAKTLFRAQQYFDFYEDVFGSLSNVQKLSEDEELKRAFETGALQVFENVDEDGRALIVITLARIVNFDRAVNRRATSLLMVKMLNYVILRTLKNYPTTQRKGFIFLCDMHGLSFEHFNVNYSRVNIYAISNFMPIRAERAGIIRPLLFTKFLLPTLKYFAFASPKMRAKFHILTQDPSILLEKPFQFRVEQVPPEYGGTNKISYGIAERIQTWTLEEEGDLFRRPRRRRRFSHGGRGRRRNTLGGKERVPGDSAEGEICDDEFWRCHERVKKQLLLLIASLLRVRVCALYIVLVGVVLKVFRVQNFA
jgi:hypothetical protein